VSVVDSAVGLARAHGLRVEDPVVLRDLSNVIVHLRPSPVVARMAAATAEARRGASDWLRRDLDVAGFLAARGAPVAGPTDELPPGPHQYDGVTVTFWRHVEHDPDGVVDGRELGESLAALHQDLAAYPGELPHLSAHLDEAADLCNRVEAAGQLAPADAALLRERIARVRPLLSASGSPEQALHGDAHAGNVLVTAAGPVWTDLEDTCRGPLAWDLACMVASSRVLDGGDPARDEAALAACGGHELELDALIEARALQAVAWGVFVAQRRPGLRDWAERRLHWLRGEA
jgi:hypothetical protein